MREHGRPRDQQPRARHPDPCRLERGRNGAQILGSGIEIQPVGCGLRQHQRPVVPLSLGGEPHAMHAAHAAAAGQRLHHRRKGAGRIGQAIPLHQGRGGGLQAVEHTLKIAAQLGRPEPCGLLRRQQVSIPKQGVDRRLVQHLPAILDHAEPPVLAQPLRHPGADGGQPVRRRPLDAKQKQAARRARPQLLQHQTAGGGLPGRQQVGQVTPHTHGGEAQGGDRRGDKHGQQQRPASRACRRHGAG